jgi:hypothetical protein
VTGIARPDRSARSPSSALHRARRWRRHNG